MDRISTLISGGSLSDAEPVGDFVQLALVAAADGDEVEVGVRLVDGEELCAEAQSHHRHVEDILAHDDCEFCSVAG